MDSLTFGVIAFAVGMGGTLLSLAVLSLMIWALTRVFPAKEAGENEATHE